MGDRARLNSHTQGKHLTWKREFQNGYEYARTKMALKRSEEQNTSKL